MHVLLVPILKSDHPPRSNVIPGIQLYLILPCGFIFLRDNFQVVSSIVQVTAHLAYLFMAKKVASPSVASSSGKESDGWLSFNQAIAE